MTPQTATTAAPRTAPRPRTRDRRGHTGIVQHHSDADIYAGVARAWWLMTAPESTTSTQCGPTSFVLASPRKCSAAPRSIPMTCLRYALDSSRWRTSESEIATTTSKCEGFTEGLDPIRGLWLPLTNTPELGVHFWQLVIVPVELRCIGPVDDPPSLEYGRFARGRLRAVPARR
jgi:hypothetical protein